MDWVFLVFAVATGFYTLYIIKEHLADSRIQKTLIEHLESERAQLESKIEEQNAEGAGINEEIKQNKEAVKELQETIKKQEEEIRKFEESMAKRGKYRVE